MKKILLAIAALFCTTLSFAQEFMVVEHVNGVYNAIDVDYIKQGYFKTYEASGLGTAEDPFNIAAANAKCKETGETPTAQDYYIKGVIVSTPRNTSGTTFFYIADDISGINRLYAYQVLLYGNYELQRGDEVVLFCSLYNYSNYSPEATGEIVSINGQAIETPKPQGAGTLEDPYNVMAALEYIKGLGADVQSDKDIYVKGYITTIREQFSAQYGNAQFTMSDSKEGSNTLTFYRGLYLGNRKWVEGDATLAEGDEVIICGKVVNYKGTTPETVQNKAYIYSLNGKTDDTPIETAGTLAKPFTPAEANAFIATLPADTNTDKDYYIKGKLVKYANKGEFGIQYGNASFYISEDGSESSELFYVFRTLYLGNVKYNDESWVTPAVGDEVVICGKLVNYKGTTPETVANNSYIYLLNANNNGSGGGDSPSSDAKVVTIADFNAAAVSTDKWYQLTGTIKNLKDSDPYGNFDLEDSTGSVYVYGLLSEKGGEKKKFQDLVAAKGISNGKKITIVGTRGEYNGKIEVLNAYFVSIEGGNDTSGNTGLETNFANGQGAFTIEDKDLSALSFVWKADSKGYMKASAYANATNNAAESWLVSPTFSLKNATTPVMTFNNCCNYTKEGNITDYIKVMIFDGANWNEAAVSNLPDGKSWTFVDSTVDLKPVAGKENVKIAFKYVSTTVVAPTWEIKTVSIK